MIFFPILMSFNEFISGYWYYLVIGIVGIILIVLAIILLLKKDKKPVQKIASKEEYIQALGGLDNILSHELKGSRIVLKLANYQSIDQEKIKEAGVDSFVLMSDKLTLVVKTDPKKVYEVIFPD